MPNKSFWPQNSCLIIASNFIFPPIIYNAEYAFMTIVTQIIEISQAGLFVSIFVTDMISFNSPVSSFGYILPVIFVSICFIQYFSALSLTNAISININCAIQDFCLSKFGDITPNTLFETRHVFVSYSKIHLVVQIRDVHGQLCYITSEISRFYSLAILITLSLISYILLYNVYYLFEAITVRHVGVDYMIIENTLLWIISMLYPPGSLTSKATKVTNEVEKTENLVHTLLNCTIDRQTKVELEQFSLQLLHRKIKFTANQYFSLNNTLFQSILSTVTTYMVIPIQVQVGTSVHFERRILFLVVENLEIIEKRGCLGN